MKNSFEESAGRQASPNGTATSVPQDQNIQPRFIRLPKNGSRCPHTGLTRTQIYLFIKSGLVKSISLKRSGTSRGTRLIDFDSLCAAIRSFEASEQQQSNK